jgi:hypothetical protein
MPEVQGGADDRAEVHRLTTTNRRTGGPACRGAFCTPPSQRVTTYRQVSDALAPSRHVRYHRDSRGRPGAGSYGQPSQMGPAAGRLGRRGHGGPRLLHRQRRHAHDAGRAARGRQRDPMGSWPDMAWHSPLGSSPGVASAMVERPERGQRAGGGRLEQHRGDDLADTGQPAATGLLEMQRLMKPRRGREPSRRRRRGLPSRAYRRAARTSTRRRRMR